MRVERGTRGGTWFVHKSDGYHYHINRRRNNIMYLKCIRFERGCHGRAVLRRGEDIEHTKRHTCIRDDIHTQVMALRRAILARCRTLDYVPFARIVEIEGARFPRIVRREVTAVRMRTAMRNSRMSMFPPVPHTLADLSHVLIDPRYRVLTMTSDGEDNILQANVVAQDGCRSLILSSSRLMGYLRNAHTLHCDGTFKMVPRIAGLTQILIIVTTWRHQVVPLVWVLMESKNQSSYCAVLRAIRQLIGRNGRLQKVITDFEPALQNAWHLIFGIEVQGCLWHEDRAFVRHFVIDLQLRDWLQVPVVSNVLRLCCAIPLLPQNLLLQGLLLIARHTLREGRFFYNILLPFFVYIWRQWILHAVRGQTMSVYRSYARTNNASESANRMLREDIMVPHANIYHFLGGLLSHEDKCYQRVDTLMHGNRVSRRRKAVSVLMDQRLQNLAADLEDNQAPLPLEDRIFAYLRTAAHLLENVVEDIIEAL